MPTLPVVIVSDDWKVELRRLKFDATFFIGCLSVYSLSCVENDKVPLALCYAGTSKAVDLV